MAAAERKITKDVIVSAKDKADFRKKFICPEESSWYSSSVEQMVFNRLRDCSSPVIVEFGSGTGSPVVSALLNSDFSGTVHGYEINKEALDTANGLIAEYGLNKKYITHHGSFFESRDIPKSEYLIANPPYLPAMAREQLTLPDLYGGREGIDVSKRLLSRGYENVLLLMSSYSNPAKLVDHASRRGYKVSDFRVTPLPFGVYSRQDHVQERIHEMKKAGKAFFSKDCYLLGSALFTKAPGCKTDMSSDLLACLTSAGRFKSRVGALVL